MFETFANAPDGVKAFLIGCALIFIIGVICIIAESVEESRHEERKYKHGHS